MKALSVHGGGAVFANISAKFGLRGQYGPDAVLLGMATVSGLDGT